MEKTIEQRLSELTEKYDALRQYIQDCINDGQLPLPTPAQALLILKPHKLLPPREPDSKT